MYSRRLPAHNRNYLGYFPNKKGPTKLKISKSNGENFRGSTEFHRQNLMQIGSEVHELWSNIQHRQKDITTLYIKIPYHSPRILHKIFYY